MINYTYEAYGVPKITINNSLMDGKLLLTRKLKELSIFLYKGYIYDSETKLYYCETRYYDPEVGRWLSVDSFNYMDPSSPNGLNLYAYCLNNPVMFSDPDGKLPFLIIAGMIGLVIGVGTGTYVGINKGHTGWRLVGDIALGGLIGAAAGLLVGGTVSALLTGSFLSSWSGIKIGGKLVYGMYKSGGIAAAGYMMMDNLGHAFNPFTHIFWSGGDTAKNAANNYASGIDGKTLEMTRLGKYLEKNFNGTNYNQYVWTIGSKNFVNQVPRGSSVNAILYYPGMRADAVWFEEAEELARRLIEIIIGR